MISEEAREIARLILKDDAPADQLEKCAQEVERMMEEGLLNPPFEK
jgi:hypothetical protein